MDKASKEKIPTAATILLVFSIELMDRMQYHWLIIAAIALLIAGWHFRR